MLLRRWSTRRLNAWCHGDLHGGNALRRADGSCVLIDLALIHPGHWLEDALYLERVCWSRMQAKSRADTAARAAGNGWHGQHFGDRHAFSHHGAGSHAGEHKGEKHRNGTADQSPSMLSQMAGFRRELGLACDDDYGMLANVRRVLMAACAPAWIQREGNPLHLAHALELIQKLLPMVGR